MENKYLMNTYGRYEVLFQSGKGSYLYDANSQAYLDFVSGIAVDSLGHCNDIVVEAIARESRNLMHVSNLYWTQNQFDLAKLLVEASNLDKVFFANSGTEANEGAMKLARLYGNMSGSNVILYMSNSFHGRSLGSLSITGQEKYQAPYKPLFPNTVEVAFNDVESLREHMNENVCGLFIEPIQGEGGVTPATLEFLREARILCNKFDSLLIFDEVQTGMGRSGNMFAFQNYNVVPDVLTLAKGLGSGFPIGAIVAGKKASNVFKPGDHGSTFGGNPLACGVGISVMNKISEKEFLDGIIIKHQLIIDRLNEIKGKTSCIKDIRGMGLLIGIEFFENAKPIIQKSFDNKLLLIGAGDNVIRIIPALTISKDELISGLAILENAILEFHAD
ncbi:MAG: aspartate aminotransferase family protein [Eubacteriales bacterium]